MNKNEKEKIYRGMKVMPDNMDIGTYIYQNKKTLFLLVTSSCLPEKKVGSYRLMLSFKDTPKLLTKELKDVSNANECILRGILDTVDSLVQPNYEIVVINCIGTGMHRFTQNKKVANEDLITQIFEKLENKQCFISELVFKSKANEIKNLINTNYPLSKNKKNSNDLKHINLNEYTKEIIQNTRKEVFGEIVNRMITMRFTKESIASVLNISEKDVDNLSKNK